MRMKVGEIEIEASTPEDLGQLLRKALDVKAAQAKPARDHE
jgi:hypothetical protein